MQVHKADPLILIQYSNLMLIHDLLEQRISISLVSLTKEKVAGSLGHFISELA